MGTEVLRPQEYFNRRVGLVTSPTPIFTQRNRRNFNRKQPVRSVSDRSKPVTILKRGESLDSKVEVVKKEEPIVTGSMTKQQIRFVDLNRVTYAGSSYTINSPSPDSLPVPSFSRKKEASSIATRDLRRLLGLE